MASVINVAEKYEKKLEERFKLSSITDAYCGHDFEWDGVKTIRTWSIDTVGVNNYTRSGTTRFGNVLELGDTSQSYTVDQDKAFTFSIDAGNAGEQFNIKQANRALKRQWDEVIVPDVDAYRFGVWANGAGTVVVNGTALTKATVITALLTAHAALNNLRVPKGKARVTFVSETLAIACKLNTELNGNEPFTTKAIVNGQIGVLNGSPIVAVPDDLFPEGVEFMIKYKGSSVDPMKRKVLRVQKNPMGIDGDVCEGRYIFDSFVLASRSEGIYVYAQSGAATTPTITISSGTATLTAGTGETIVYTLDGSNPKNSGTAATYDSTNKPTVTSGETIRAYAYKSGSVNSGIAKSVG